MAVDDGLPASGRIIGIGAYVPERVLTNFDLEKMVETSDEWITTRTGIKERRVVAEDEGLAELVVRAANSALENAGTSPDEIDLFILATATPHQPIPATAAIVQPQIGLVNAVCFDLSAACSGFIYALCVARQFLALGQAKKALVMGAECLTRYLDWTDRTTCVLFGDGAGAVVLEACPRGEGILRTAWKTDGRYWELIQMPGGGSRYPPNRPEYVDQRLPFIKMRGNETFKVAVRALSDISAQVLRDAGIGVDDIDIFIPHQANIRIINAVAHKLGLPPEKVYSNLHKVGNTSAASIPLAMVDAVRDGRLKRGDLVLASAFGGGLTWGSILFRY